MKRCYVPKKFGIDSLAMIQRCNDIITEYQSTGYMLSLRQLYYQLVRRNMIRNHDKEYKRLGDLINDARLAGLVDWAAIEDRGRHLRQVPHWENPAAIVQSASHQYEVDMWANQDCRPEVWVEKDALVGVIGQAADKFNVPYFSCRGYSSVTSIYEASQRMLRRRSEGQMPVLIHLGDHDPSGIDMTRDIGARLGIFNMLLDVKRIALNMDQVEEYEPPPNPAKVTDSRYHGYVLEYGAESWELDALPPEVLDEVITKAITGLIDPDRWKEQEALRERGRKELRKVAKGMGG